MSPPPTILVVGATGNTGQGVIRTLPALVKNQGYRVLGLTRSVNSAVSKELASLPLVEMLEKPWTDINAAWLKEQNVVKAYVASHNEPSQFADESTLYVACLNADVKYVVRVSTHPDFMAPSSGIFYGRTHWAIENLLCQPDFDALPFTSLRPTFFANYSLSAAADWVKTYRKDGAIHPLVLTPTKDGKVAHIDPYDVGVVGAHLLALSDDIQAQHHNQRYVINGPEDITGAEIVLLVEQAAGVKLPEDRVTFRNDDWIDQVAPTKTFAESVHNSIAVSWRGGHDVATMKTSQPVLDLAPPKISPKETFEKMVK